MPKISIFGYYGQGNAGDEAILAALSQGIKKKIPNAKICAYSANPEKTRKDHNIYSFYFFSLKKLEFLKKLFNKRAFSRISSFINFLTSDLIIIGGGGLYCDQPATNKWMLYYVDLIKFSSLFNKKIILIGVSVGPLYHQESKEAICNAFKFANAISVRDALSKELLCECGLDAERISIIPDLVYTLESAPKKIIDAILLQENMRTNNKSVAMTPCYYNESTPGWTEQYARMCSRILEETSLDIWLVPMQRGKGHDDHTAATNIFNSLSPALQARVKVLQGLYSATEIQGIIQQADYVIAERLHGSIMAINTRRPLRAIAYKPKVTGVLAHAKLSKNIITMDEFLSNALPQNVFELFNEAPDQSGMNDIRHEANQNFALIERVLNQVSAIDLPTNKQEPGKS
jgi:polysaccharide pyruvyl transferase CsaB